MTEFVQSLTVWQWIGCLAALWIICGPWYDSRVVIGCIKVLEEKHTPELPKDSPEYLSILESWVAWQKRKGSNTA